jgi:hypothetical protein
LAQQLFKCLLLVQEHTQPPQTANQFGLDALVVVLEVVLQRQIPVVLVVIQHLAHHY